MDVVTEDTQITYSYMSPSGICIMRTRGGQWSHTFSYLEVTQYLNKYKGESEKDLHMWNRGDNWRIGFLTGYLLKRVYLRCTKQFNDDEE